MTDAQDRALRELGRLCQSAPGDFEIVGAPVLQDGGVAAKIRIRIGPIATREGGLDLRESEEFWLTVPSGFPFDRPHLSVSHDRFSGFPHVTWGKSICLYQSGNEWNPSDGLYGFFDRLNLWLSKAAINDMDPIEGPLEPPHHVTTFSQKPFVILADAPCAAGERWIGIVHLTDHANRTELVRWDDLSGSWPDAGRIAFAAILPKPIASEFPKNGADLFVEFEKAGLDRDTFLRYAALAALFTPEGQPVHFVLGFPMRRSADGTPRIHVAVWTTSAERASYLRLTLPGGADSASLKELRDDLRVAIVGVLSASTISWCQILEDRPEIVSRRDIGRPMAWFDKKNVLILGCGALGSWAAEIVARAGASAIGLVDNSIVKPGVLTRQNFTQDDIGENKSRALARRIGTIAARCAVTAQPKEAFLFLNENKDALQEYDVIFDCTASSIFQMKIEKSWSTFEGKIPTIVSILIDGDARHCIAVVVAKGTAGGIWSSYLSLKKSLCTNGGRSELASAFYEDRSKLPVFLPEPGCSDPTFVGSTADVMTLLSSLLNATAGHLNTRESTGIALSAQVPGDRPSAPEVITKGDFVTVIAGKYRVHIAANVFAQAKGWVGQSSRLRGKHFETGGLLWGTWDDAVHAIWIFDASGPPPDSLHSPTEFICGTKGTAEDHIQRIRKTFGVCGFVGHWHTHPNVPSQQSSTDLVNMASLVSTVGGNQKRSVMLIFGRTSGSPTAGLYVYESESAVEKGDRISVGIAQIALTSAVA